MKLIKKIALWVAVAFFALLALGSLPTLAGFLALLTIALLIPMEKWQGILKRIFKGKLKTIVTIALVVITIVALPSEVTDSLDGDNVDIPGIVTTTSTEQAQTTTVEKINKTTTTIATTTTVTAHTTTTPKILATTTTTTSPAKTSSTTTTIKKTTTTTVQQIKYVLNTSSKKFHKITCKKLPTANREDTTMSRAEIIGLGYEPCGICKP
ncbi:MAG: hypothetical protein IKU51_04620 [Clostridia bacterium]|nr:hypothetical protein [Clostridia bacterium]